MYLTFLVAYLADFHVVSSESTPMDCMHAYWYFFLAGLQGIDKPMQLYKQGVKDGMAMAARYLKGTHG